MARGARSLGLRIVDLVSQRRSIFLQVEVSCLKRLPWVCKSRIGGPGLRNHGTLLGSTEGLLELHGAINLGLVEGTHVGLKREANVAGFREFGKYGTHIPCAVLPKMGMKDPGQREWPC